MIQKNTSLGKQLEKALQKVDQMFQSTPGNMLEELEKINILKILPYALRVLAHSKRQTHISFNVSLLWGLICSICNFAHTVLPNHTLLKGILDSDKTQIKDSWGHCLYNISRKLPDALVRYIMEYVQANIEIEQVVNRYEGIGSKEAGKVLYAIQAQYDGWSFFAKQKISIFAEQNSSIEYWISEPDPEPVASPLP